MPVNTSWAVMGSFEEEGLPLKNAADRDRETLNSARILGEAVSRSVFSFDSDIIMEQLVKNFRLAGEIYGKRLLQEICDDTMSSLEKNVKIPEYRRELRKRIEKKLQGMKKRGYLDDKHALTDRGMEIAAYVMFIDELDRLKAMGLGDWEHKKAAAEGERDSVRAYSRGDRFRDIDVRNTLKTAARRRRRGLNSKDIRVSTRRKKGEIYIIYALDASGSMKGDKLSDCKRAGIALSFDAVEKGDKAGLVVFGSDIKEEVAPTGDFGILLRAIGRARASRQTDIRKTIERACDLFPRADATKHLVLITDAMPTIGPDPHKETLRSASVAHAAGVSISVVGISLEKNGRKLAEEVARIGHGKLYLTAKTKDIDMLVLQDYRMLREG